MTPEQWKIVKELTADALEKEPAARRRFVETSPCEDPDIRKHVLELIHEHEEADTLFLDPPLLTPGLSQLSTLLPGQVVQSRFEIIRFIAEGGMGEVYEAWDLEVKEAVALKAIRPEIASDVNMVDCFKQEVRHARRISHRNVCRVNELFTFVSLIGRPQAFLTMELLIGETIAERIGRAGPLGCKEAFTIIEQIVAALAAAHDVGVVHRDFKCSNVILVSDPRKNIRAVVCDFGLARPGAVTPGSALTNSRSPVGTAEKTIGQRAGTPACMAPEQLNGGIVSYAADIFALGLAICEMLTGTLPRLDRATPERLDVTLDSWLHVQKTLTPQMRRVIKCCLQFSPDKRFRDVREIASMLNPRKDYRHTQRKVALGIAIMLLLVISSGLHNSFDNQVVDSAQLTPDSSLSGDPSLSQDGKWLAYMSDRGQPGNLDIWLQSTSNGLARRLTNDPGEDTEPSISPDGKFVAFRSERNEGNGVYIIRSDGTGERLLVPGGRTPAFSPDGRRVAYWRGTKDNSISNGQIYLVGIDGGRPVRLAPTFADARFPSWHSDGRSLLFEGCREVGQFPNCVDWWVVGVNGGELANIHALKLLQQKGIESQDPPLKVWRNERIIFSGRQGTSTSLWEFTMGSSRKSLRGLRKITQGETKELVPTLSADGKIAYGRASGALHIWQISTKLDGKTAPVQVTDNPASDCCPSISVDNHWLFFTRRQGDFRQLFARDLSSGRESMIFAEASGEFCPVANRDGSEVAFEIRKPTSSSVAVIDRAGVTHQRYSGFAHPTAWFGAEKSILYTTANGSIGNLNIHTGRSSIAAVGEKGVSLADADWSPVHEYLLVTASTNSGLHQVFAGFFSSATETPVHSWIPLTLPSEDAEHARWSADGRRLFYLSKRDGFRCLWERRFDPAGDSLGEEPFPIVHYHNPRMTPDRTGDLVLGLSVSNDSVFLNVGEVTATVWLGAFRILPNWNRWKDLLNR